MITFQLYNMFHNDPIKSPRAGRPNSAPSTPVKKRGSPDVNLLTPSPKRAQNIRSKSTTPIEHTPKQRKKSPQISHTPPPQQNGPNVSTSSSIQLDSNYVGKVMDKILQKKQPYETPLGNKGRKVIMPSFEGLEKVKKQLTFDDPSPTSFHHARRKTNQVDFNVEISAPKIEIEDLASENEYPEMDLFVLRKKLKNEEVQ